MFWLELVVVASQFLILLLLLKQWYQCCYQTYSSSSSSRRNPRISANNSIAFSTGVHSLPSKMRRNHFLSRFSYLMLKKSQKAKKLKLAVIVIWINKPGPGWSILGCIKKVVQTGNCKNIKRAHHKVEAFRAAIFSWISNTEPLMSICPIRINW